MQNILYNFFLVIPLGNREFEMKYKITVEPVLSGTTLSGHPSKRSKFLPNQQKYDRATEQWGSVLSNLHLFFRKASCPFV